MKKITIITLFLLALNSYSQIIFEKGFIIHNDGEKEFCFIKNVDWKDNPTKISYKTSLEDKEKIATIEDIQEFSIDDFSNYKRFIVEIDRSSENINLMSNIRKPIFKQETLFLKTLIEGDASLYEYSDESLRRYFFSTKNQLIKQLIYKPFLKSESRINKNEYYKQQLINHLKCTDVSINRIMKFNYKQRELINLFVTYNHCTNSSFTNFEESNKRDLFNLNVKLGLKNSSLSINNTAYDSNNIDFGGKIGYVVGIGAEFLLPFSKNKWGIIFEPTYQSFKAEKTKEVANVVGGKLFVSVNYKSIDLPVGIRYYMFLKNDSRLFVNAALVYNVSSNSTIQFDRADGSNLKLLEIKAGNVYTFGVGYNYQKYSIELKIDTPRDVLSNYISWNSEYTNVSFVLSYNLF